ncbi:hypothetical protein J6590_053221 [Homalodisca vitripennis]|nr:hypothetical protein J6590_053221 [Homalodisca vitripennis]
MIFPGIWLRSVTLLFEICNLISASGEGEISTRYLEGTPILDGYPRYVRLSPTKIPALRSSSCKSRDHQSVLLQLMQDGSSYDAFLSFVMKKDKRSFLRLKI